MANPECGYDVIRNLMPHSHILRAALNPIDPSAPLLLILAVLKPSAEPHFSSGPNIGGFSQAVADDIHGPEHSNLYSGELPHVRWNSAAGLSPIIGKNSTVNASMQRYTSLIIRVFTFSSVSAWTPFG